ncbi:MAG: hypothetical protein HWE15_14215 [Algoriphagus sp.]|uniref:S41 family peptidase n=1 Tax=Algoriphagus sp. TaxID=1872435 RepID=UPI0017FEB1E0|nr:S41 family peptidase [Algoriphagus sp.]NVJ87460.1 hypothetical protein [Algoriphagus sp.]
MNKKVLLFVILIFALLVGFLTSLSDPAQDDSYKFVAIDHYLTNQELVSDIDSLAKLIEHIHPNPYRFVAKKDFYSQLDSIKGTLPDSMSTLNFWRLVDQILIQINDAHSYVDDRFVLTDYINKEKLFLPLSAKIQSEKIIITKNEDLEQLLPEGIEIESINGKSAEEIIEALLTHATKETPYLKRLQVSDDFGFYLWKTYDWESEFKIHFKDKNSATLDSITLKGIPWEKRKKSSAAERDSFTFKFLNKSTGYLKITDFNGDEDEILTFYEESFNAMKEANTTHLIIDFRGHQGGADNYGEHLAKYIARQPFRKLSKAYWKITPEFKEAFDRRFVPKGIRWFKPIYLVNEYSSVFYGAKPNELITVTYKMKKPLPEKERFLGEVYLITDHQTFSAASIFAEMFKYFKMGKIIGQPTGNLYSFNGFALVNPTLPHSKISFQVSSVYNIANNQEQGLQSVEPDIFIDPKDDPNTYILENLIRN